jgi:hypothetical protein
MKKALGMLLGTALCLMGADLTGTWAGSFDMTNSAGETHNDVVHMELKQVGNTVSGTVGPSADRQWKIINGKIDGKTITWEVNPDANASVKFKLTLDGDRLHGDAAMERGDEKRSVKVDVKRKA